MDRKTYMIKCQKCAVLEDGPMKIKKDVPAEDRVKFNGVEYYPEGYSLKFNKQGGAIHIAVLHDLKANCVVRCPLDEVEAME